VHSTGSIIRALTQLVKVRSEDDPASEGKIRRRST